MNVTTQEPRLFADFQEENVRSTKKDKLVSLCASVLCNPIYKAHFERLLQRMNLMETDVIESFLAYNMDIYSSVGNSIYGSLANRVVLYVHNLMQGSWHIERQRVIDEFVAFVNPGTLIDVGFGVPSAYIKKSLFQPQEVKLVLADLYDSAFKFAEILLQLWSENWKDRVKFQRVDMNKNNFLGEFDLYLFQDSIEHVEQPAAYLKQQVECSRNTAKFLLSLPIGPIFPRHYIAWHSKEEASQWLSGCGLKIFRSADVHVNPGVDLFAEQLSCNFFNYIVLCSKE